MSKRSHKDDKLAKVYETQVFPIWGKYFAKLALDHLEPPAKATILEVGCQDAYVSLELLRRLDADGRIVAIDPSPSLLDEARIKAGPLGGKRLFLRSDHYIPRLAFTDDVYDIVLSSGHELEEPERTINEFARVAKERGRVVVSLPLAGTFQEFFDIFREVLIKRDQKTALLRLEAHVAAYPTLEQAEGWFKKAGLENLSSDHSSFTLLFRSSREFFFSPLIEYGPLAAWKAVAGKGQEMQDVFWMCKEAIDTYFKHSTFATTVEVGVVRGTKMLSEAERRVPESFESAYTPTSPVHIEGFGAEEYDTMASELPFGPEEE